MTISITIQLKIVITVLVGHLSGGGSSDCSGSYDGSGCDVCLL